MSTDASAPRMSSTGDPKDYEPTYGNPKVSTSNDVAFQKEVRSDAAAGAKAPLKIGEVGGQTYPGRALPPTQKVVDAQCRDKGFAKKQADKQLTENRQELK